MTTIIAALYDDVSTAHSAVYTLVQYGIDRHKIQIVGQESDESTVNYIKEGYVARTGFDTLRQGDDLNEDHQAIRKEADANPRAEAGYSDDEPQHYSQEIRRGGTLVIAELQEAQTEDAINVLQRYKPIRLEEQPVALPQQGTVGKGDQPSFYTREQLSQKELPRRSAVDDDSVVNRPPLSEDLREEDEF
jgi:hypothetical protein